MNVLDHMTLNEATVLAAVLLDGGKDKQLWRGFEDFYFESQAAEVIANVICAVSADVELNVITVFEESLAEEREEGCSMELLTAICQYIQPREKTMAILRGEA